MITPFQAMQAAVDILQDSPHPKNKIACTVFNDAYSVSRTNHWPAIIEEKLGRDIRIGNSSGTIHAETSALTSAWNDGIPTDGMSLCVSDPFCPNCAKNIAEAGIKTIYIDHKGFKKDFFARRSDHFENMSMQICEKAGISVYELWRKDEKIVPIFMAPEDYKAPNDSPITADEIDTPDEATFQNVIAGASALHNRRKFTVAFAQKPEGGTVCLIARAHAVVGFSMQDPQDAVHIENPQGKYSFIQEPVNRMLMHMVRYGYRLQEGAFYCSQVPTAREQVNLVGAGIKRITVGDMGRYRGANSLAAMELLSQHDILDYS
ncbi:MAG: deoxycytidylate deaminase [Pseudomonadota bacterium]